MAEPLGSNDIEDVVSSVRRLVSPEARARPATRDPGPDLLVLTPALRVVAEEQGAPVEPLVLTLRVEEPEGAEAAPEPAPDPQPARATEGGDAPADRAAVPGGAGAGETVLHVVDSEWEDAFWSEPEPARSERAPGAEEAGVLPTTAMGDAAEVLPEAEPEAIALFPPADLAPEARVDDDPAQPAAEAVPLEALAELKDADGNPVLVLDETALNDMVRHLIREELQGVLGERITQNVRKLVRAEINRALTARSLD